MKKCAVWLDEVDKEDITTVGGKGANLGEMTKAKLPVPPGFIVTAQAYFYFLDTEELRPKIAKLLYGLDCNDAKKLQQTSRSIRTLITDTPMPRSISDPIIEYYFSLCEQDKAGSKKKLSLIERLTARASAHRVAVAVRSSATAEDLPEASFAGQQATYLNVRGEANVINAVRKAWASLFTARAIFYRTDQKFDHFKVGIAVPVQKMVNSDTSGVMFTVDPVSHNKNTIVVEAIYGLGELIVGGVVTPDHYEVDKKSGRITNKIINAQTEYMPGLMREKTAVPHKIQKLQKITDEQVKEVAELGKKLEKHYYFPQDIEWAYEQGTLYVVQTRPITTLGNEEETDKTKQMEKALKRLKEIARGNPASPGVGSGTVSIIHNAGEINKIDPGEILVAEQTNPDFVPAMKKASAIVTQKGGRTSHAAIVSRELGLPAVVGVDGILQRVSESMEITVDGEGGIIYKGRLPEHLVRKAITITPSEERARETKTATHVYVNLANVDRAEEVGKMHVDGIGLLRAEFMLADIGVHPRHIIKMKQQKKYIQELAENIAVFCKAFAPDRPVIYRTTDFKTNEYRNLKHGEAYETHEENPMLGFRGTGRYIVDADVFELELEAIRIVRQKMGYRNLHVMLPFVRTPKQLQEAKKLIAGMKLMRTPSFKLWMMVEIPTNVIRIEDFLAVGIDGVSIGSNDLTQLTLGIDRDNEKIAADFSELDPSVLWSLERVIAACNKHHVTASICGQAPSDYPELVDMLVDWGITSVSVNPDAIYKTRLTIVEAEKRKFRKKK